MGKLVATGVAGALLIGAGYWWSEAHPEEATKVVNAISNVTGHSIPVDPGIPTETRATTTTSSVAEQEQAGCTSLENVDPKLVVGQVVMALAHTDKDGTGVNELPQLEDAVINHGVGNFTFLDVYPPSISFHKQQMSIADVITTIKAENASANGIDMVVGIDDEGGRVQRTKKLAGFDQLPSAREMGRTMTPEQVTNLFKAHGEKLKQLGVTLDLAPVADVGNGSQLGDRTFGVDPDKVVAYASAVTEGLKQAGLASALKHFPGVGAVNTDTHNSAGVTPSFDNMQDSLAVFSTLMASIDPPFVLVSHASTPGLTDPNQPASMSPAVYALLKNTYGFNGVAMTDGLGMGAINIYTGETDPAASQAKAAKLALAAGADMVLVDAPQAGFVADQILAEIVGDGSVPRASVFSSAAKILQIKGYAVCA